MGSILVDGCQPYSEDPWKTIKINNLTFQGVKLCSRCKVRYCINILLALKLIMQFMSGGDMITLMKKKSLARQAWPCGLIVKLLNCTIILY